MVRVGANVANAYGRPFRAGFFDAIYLITAIGEHPEPGRALNEFCRVLSPFGSVAFSEMLTEHVYPSVQTRIRLALKAQFQLKRKLGNFSYTLAFDRVLSS